MSWFLWQCELYDDLSECPYTDERVYRTREEAEKRAERMTFTEDGTVTGIQYGADGRTMVAVRPNGWDTSTWRNPEEYRHHQPDSWESIIEDAANYEHDGWQGSFRDFVDGMVERCRRLAGEGA